MGNVKPDNTSALMVMQTNAEVPLENIRAGLYEWVEDIGAILLDMMGTYYGKRPIVRDRTFEEPVIDPATGIPKVNQLNGQMEMKRVTRRVSEEFDFSQFKHLWMNIRADVGATSQFSEIAMVQTLDNLRANGTLDVIQYLERIPDKLIPKRAELIEELKTRMGMQAEQLAMQGQSAQNGAAAGAAAAAQMLMTEGGSTVGGPLNEKNAVAAISARTLDKYREYIARFFSWANSEGYISKDPAKSIPAIKHEVTPRVALSQVELEYLRSACETPRETAIVEMLYSTGCRVSELAGLK